MQVGQQESTDEVVFKGLDGSFCRVDMVGRRFNSLLCIYLCLEESFDRCCCLIFCHIELECVALVLLFVEYFFKCRNDRIVSEVGAGFSK